MYMLCVDFLILQKLYEDKLGAGLIDLIKDSGVIDPATLNPSTVCMAKHMKAYSSIDNS